MVDTPEAAATPPLSFEQALDRLEAVVHDLEEGQVGLAEGLARYEEGIRLLKQCYLLLERAERRIELLGGADSQGGAATTDFDDSALSLEEKAATRSRRRSTRKPAATRPAEETLDPNVEEGGPAASGDMDSPGKLF